MILLLELAARIGPQASFWKSALLFEFAAVITIAGEPPPVPFKPVRCVFSYMLGPASMFPPP